MKQRIVAAIAGALLAAAVAMPVGAPPAGAQIEQMMDVTPFAGLSDADEVTVSGLDWSPNTTLDVVECLGVDGPDDCDWSTADTVTTDTSGAFTTQFVVHQEIDPVNDPNTDCRVSNCKIAVATPSLSQVAFHSIDFAGGTLTPTPDANLIDGQSIALNGAGWLEGATLYVLECRPDQPVSLNSCDLATQQSYTVAPDGTVVDDFTVSQSISTPSGDVDCAAVPDGCGLGGVVWPGDFGFGFPLMIDPPSNNVINFGSADPSNPPQSKNDCKKGGWHSYTDDEGTPFANQGDCVSYVATGGKNKAKG